MKSTTGHRQYFLDFRKIKSDLVRAQTRPDTRGLNTPVGRIYRTLEDRKRLHNTTEGFCRGGNVNWSRARVGAT